MQRGSGFVGRFEPWRPSGRPGSGCFGCLSVFLDVAAGGFALTARHFFQTPGMPAQKKVPKKACSCVRPLAGSGFLRSGIDPGAAATVCFAAPTSAVSGCARRSLRSHARINPSAQPSDVAGGSKALELRSLLSGAALPRAAALLLWERACSLRRSDSQFISNRQFKLPSYSFFRILRS